MDVPTELEIQVLGPLRSRADGVASTLGGPKQRLVLALLVLEPGRPVATERLIDGVWPTDPPRTARKTLQGYVHHLRNALGDVVRTEPSGYTLEVEPEAIDAVLFEREVAEARAIRSADPLASSRLLQRALARWHGQPFEDLTDAEVLLPTVTRLIELRLVAVEARIDAELDVVDTASLVPELESLTREHPYRERLRALHMVALYRSGRQAEALRSFQQARFALREDLGLDPGPDLVELESRILDHDPTLAMANPAVSEVPDPVGAAISGYEVRARVGAGGLGVTYRAFQAASGREVALKVLTPEVANRLDFVEFHDDERRRLLGLEHPGVLTLLDAWREPDAAYVVRPWLSGGSLADRPRSASPSAALASVEPVAATLDAIHRAGHVHGRLTPSNIVFDHSGQPLLTDLGQTGTFGSVDVDDRRFLAPEVRAGILPPTPAADVFGFAAVVGFVLAGASQTSDGTDADGERGLDELPGEVRRALERALHVDPAVRPQRCEQVVREVRQAFGVDVGPSGALDQPAGRSVRNPYKGLRAFQQVDAGDFFGRGALIAELVDRVETHRFVALVGPSGVGKSSVVKAGLIPALRSDDAVAAPLVAEMYPGSFPFDELAAALLRVGTHRPERLVADLTADDRGFLRACKEMLPEDRELLLVVDQFEELFSLCDSAERDRFAASLAAAVTDPGTRIRIVVTLRADYYDRPLDHPALASLFHGSTVAVRSPERSDLEASIARPAIGAGVDLEPGLVPEVVADVVDQPGGLPLLQYALTVLFNDREGDELTIAAYRRSGGVLGALGRRAEELYTDLSVVGRHAIRETFLRLVAVGDGTGDLRRRVRRSELLELPVAQRELSDAIRMYGAHRLLSFDRDPVARTPTIEVAHEALLAEWPRLRGWIDAQREHLLIHRSLASAVDEWDTSGRDTGYLLGGSRLAHFEQWERETAMSLTAREREFLDASRQRRAAEEEQRQRSDRRLRRLLAGVSALALLVAAVGAVAILQADRASSEADAAQRSRAEAEARRLALEAPRLVDSDRSVSLLLAVEAWRRDPGPTSLGALQQVLTATDGFLGLQPFAAPPSWVAIGSGGHVVTADASGVRVVDATGRERSFPLRGVRRVAVSDDGIVVAAVTVDRVVVLDLSESRQVAEIAVDSAVTALQFAPGARLLGIGHFDGRVVVVDPTSGRSVSEFRAHPEASVDGLEVPPHQPDLAEVGVRALDFDRPGRRLITAGLNHVRVWQADTGRRLDEFTVDRRDGETRRVAAAIRAVGWLGPDEQHVVVASMFNIVVRDPRIGAETEVHEFTDRMNAVAFPDTNATVVVSGDHVVATESGGQVEVIRVAADSAESVVAFDAQVSGRVVGSWDPAGNEAIAVGAEGIVRWSLDGSGLIARSVPSDGRSEVMFDDTGRWISLSSPTPSEAFVYDLEADPPTLARVPTPPAVDFAFLGITPGLLTWDQTAQEMVDRSLVTFTPTSARFVAQPWALDASEELVAFGGFDPPVVDVFGVDGELVVTLEHFVDSSRVDGATARSVEVVQSLSFSADGTRLAAATVDGRSVVWDTETWEVVAVLSQGGGQIVMADFSPDDRWLVTVAADGQISLRDPETFQLDGDVLVGQVDGLDGVSHGPSFTDDGRYMITTSDGSGRIWDLEQRRVVGSGFPSDPGTAPGSSADARSLGTIRGDRAVVWNLDLDRWPELACEAAGRNLSLTEWDQFGPADAAYRPTCPNWPSDFDGES